MAVDCGWSWDRIDTCPLNIAFEIQEHLADFPSSRMLLAAQMGFRRRRRLPNAEVPPELAALPVLTELPDYVTTWLKTVRTGRDS